MSFFHSLLATSGSAVSSLVSDYIARVEADGGIVESQECLEDRLTLLNNLGFLSQASAVWLPHGYKEDKLYAVKGGSTADFSFVRSTTRTRLGPSHIEQVPYNRLRNTEEFNASAWGKASAFSGTAPVVTADYTTAPDGTSTADRAVFAITSDAGSYSRLQQPIFNSIFHNEYRFSVWLKENTGTPVTMALGSSNNGLLIEVTSDWQEFVLIFDRGSSGLSDVNVFIQLSQVAGTDLSADVSVWGAQLIQGSNALDYQVVTDRANIPALDYTLDSTCPTLSLEPARTNLALRSDDFNNASWQKFNTTVTINAIPSPDGLDIADQVLETTTNGVHVVLQAYTKAASSLTYTWSIWVKPSGRDWCALRIDDNVSANGIIKYFNVSNGTLGSTISIGSGFTFQNAEIIPYSNGWYRCVLTATTTANTGLRSNFYSTATDGLETFVGDVTKGHYIWGAQLEVGSFATSYIPTLTATVSRTADVITPLTGVTSLIGQTEGTIYWEGRVYADSVGKWVGISDNTTSNRVLLGINSSNQLSLLITSSGSLVANITNGITTVSTDDIKICGVYRSNYAALFINGVKIAQDTSVTIPSMDTVHISATGGTNPFQGNLKAVVISQVALSDADAIALTT